MGGLSETGNTPQRLDKWLWCARFYKSRSLASKAISQSGLRLTRGKTITRITKPAFAVLPDDVLTFAKGPHTKVIRIICLAKRRGPASEAQTLYEDLSPPLPPRETKPTPAFAREQGTGRPTKRDRRQLDALKGRE